ncbi:MAG TPA: 2-C-methyl-D-erythritol 2,4-cyclodiphosphate synthase [Caldithrix sp.]|nr:2-C-methyl-D-erythritol 2,4-cyclodiphosphate synthase [Caldithrix sp.]
MRFGIGVDVHGFSADRPLILGGIQIPYPIGLAGHSDADVLLHAIADALLGAMALGDIGQHFPDTSDEFRNISSTIILDKTYSLVQQQGYRLQNLDSTVMLEEPKIFAFIPEMRKRIAGILQCDLHQVSVKATTTEKLGFIGRKEGIAALAIVSLTAQEAH